MLDGAGTRDYEHVLKHTRRHVQCIKAILIAHKNANPRAERKSLITGPIPETKSLQANRKSLIIANTTRSATDIICEAVKLKLMIAPRRNPQMACEVNFASRTSNRIEEHQNVREKVSRPPGVLVQQKPEPSSLEWWYSDLWHHDFDFSSSTVRLTKDLPLRLAECTPTIDETACVNRCIHVLNETLTKIEPAWYVLPFGSQATGFALKGSDLDATCLNSKTTEGFSVVQFLNVASHVLEESSQFEVRNRILNARVPILKIRFENTIDVDLSCLNSRPLKNSRLLRAYAEMDGTVIADLCRAIKLWARSARVCGAIHRHLSNYAFTLMAIYFMQVDPSVKLPCLPVEAFSGDCTASPESNMVAPWSCPLPVHTLLARFFRFYALQFAWGREVVSVRRGRREHANGSQFKTLNCRDSRIHVEDPMELARNLNDVLGVQEEIELRAALAVAWQVVATGNTPLGLLAKNANEGTQVAPVSQPVAEARQQPMSQTRRKSIPAEDTDGLPSKYSPSPPRRTHAVPDPSKDPQQTEDKVVFHMFLACCLYTLYAICAGEVARLVFTVFMLLTFSIIVWPQLQSQVVAACVDLFFWRQYVVSWLSRCHRSSRNRLSVEHNKVG